MTLPAINTIVDDFWASRAQGVHYPPQWFGRLNLDQAYHVQLGLLEREIAAGARHVGWKVGLTAVAIREQFGVHEPVFGYLLDRGRWQSGATVEHADWRGVGFENELCLRLGKALRGPDVDAAAAARAVDTCSPALELVENRGDFGAQLPVGVADNVQQRAFVLGAPVPLQGLDLPSVQATVRVGGLEIARATGDAVMGSPLVSLAWLANKLAEYGRALEPGQYVMAGSFTRQFPLNPGDLVETEFAGIGRVGVRCV